jgi:uncharacterized protein YacL
MIVRILLVLACSMSGLFIAYNYYGFPIGLIGLIAGFLIALFVIHLEEAIRKVSLRIIFGGVFGMIVGLVIAFLLA